MRLRCPAHDCAISLPEELLGTTIRCPVCGSLISVHEHDRDLSAEQIKPGDPSVTSASEAAKNEVRDLENQIYDGLPPLSVMLALRKRQGANYDARDFAHRYEMTDDDWKALDAFESVLYAVAALRLSTVVCGIIVAINVVLLIMVPEQRWDHTRHSMHILHVIMLVCMGGCIFTQLEGARALERVQVDWLFYKLLLPVLIFAALCFFFRASMNVHSINYGDSEQMVFGNFAGLLFNGFALFDLGRSFLQARAALRQLAPPEISHRLSEALRYLA
jgi:hypothetical protein